MAACASGALLLALAIACAGATATALGQPRPPAPAYAPPQPPPPRLFERFADLILPHGYPLEEHFATTVDGYILRMFRIPHGRARPQPGSSSRRSSSHGQEQHRPLVHVQHGLLGSATDWVLNGPGLSLPLLLADAGYDVWFGNVRGNIFSRNHTRLDVYDADFWSFSWDDFAARDLPAMFERELLVSGSRSLSYVGHSQGTTIGLAFLASHAGSALAERVETAVLLAPVAFATHVSSVPLTTLATLNTDEIFTLLGFHEFLPSSEVLARLEGQLCKLQPALCVNLLAAICGYNAANLDASRLPVYLNYTPSGTSVKNMAHWSQAVRLGRPDVMSWYNYGASCTDFFGRPRPCNQAVYGQAQAPAYDLSAIRTDLALFTGGADRLSDPADVDLLLGALPLRRLLLRHHEQDYEHLDFIWGINAAKRIYGRVLRLLKQRRRPRPGES